MVGLTGAWPGCNGCGKVFTVVEVITCPGSNGCGFVFWVGLLTVAWSVAEVSGCTGNSGCIFPASTADGGKGWP